MENKCAGPESLKICEATIDRHQRQSRKSTNYNRAVTFSTQLLSTRWKINKDLEDLNGRGRHCNLINVHGTLNPAALDCASPMGTHARPYCGQKRL